MLLEEPQEPLFSVVSFAEKKNRYPKNRSVVFVAEKRSLEESQESQKRTATRTAASFLKPHLVLLFADSFDGVFQNTRTKQQG